MASDSLETLRDGFAKARQDYKENWKLLDDVLYGLCRKHPYHQEQAEIRAKVNIIGRTYSSGIERMIKSDKTPGSSMEQLTNCFIENGSQIDSWIAQLSGIQEPLTDRGVREVLAVHGQLLRLLAKITKNERRDQPLARHLQPRSFVSKYLHFHNAIVPIYDSVASAEIRKVTRKVVGWKAVRNVEFKMAVPVDSDYKDYVEQFLALYVRMRDAGLKVTVRSLDFYLMWLGS